MDKKKITGLIAIGAALSAATAAAVVVSAKKKKNKSLTKSSSMLTQKKNVYFTGGGIASLAGAVYLIRDCKYPGDSIHIFESLSVLGGSNDGTGTVSDGFICRGDRILNEKTYENFWDLISSIPSIENPDLSVTDEILNFNRVNPMHASARLIDKEKNILNVSKMGFDRHDRKLLIKLLNTDENKLDGLAIKDWFMPHFFTTNFWYLWMTTFAFKPTSSLFEFKRSINRMMFEFHHIETLEGAIRTPYNQYESIIEPLREYLIAHNVNFETGSTVEDIDFEDDSITASALHIDDNGTRKTIYLNKGDLCIMTTGCMTDSSTLGNFSEPAPVPNKPSVSNSLWENVSSKKAELGNPKAFFSNEKESAWESFTVTLHGDYLFNKIKEISGSNAVMTFKDSNWTLSIVTALQPQFKNQDENTFVFYGYGLFPEKRGNYVDKPMKQCAGVEILYELICHLNMQDEWNTILENVINVIPCYMPYINAQLMPRNMSDRPQIIPEDSTNFAMIGQFVEIPDDMVFTEEYSVRAARIAVYTLTNTHKKICPVTQYNKKPAVWLKALKRIYS